MFAEFHFLRPYWFLALIPLALLLWMSYHTYRNDSGWQKVCDQWLLPYLLMIHRSARQGWWVGLLGLGWLMAILALAGPTWSKQTQPVFSMQKGHMIVLDLSRSMGAADLKPTRLARARFKVADILARSQEGQTGLVVFAGDAFVVSPLTQDAATITALLPALDPTIMPVQGSRADLGLREAAALLQQAGFNQGDILLVADGINGESALTTVRELRNDGFRVSVLAVGTQGGAPIPLSEGGFLKDSSGNIVIPQTNLEAMESLSREGGGRYALLSNDSSDLDWLLAEPMHSLAEEVQGTDQETVVWREVGPWLVVGLLPLAAFAFRRGWLLILLVLIMPHPSWALSWGDLWQRRDQQVNQALQQGDFERAADLATDLMQRGIAAYRQGRYDQAASAFAQAPGANAHYNRGNALARLNRFEEALAAYDTALAVDPHMQDAKANRDLVEELLRQQRQQAQQNNNSDQDNAQEVNNSQGEQAQQTNQQGQGQRQSNPSQTQNNNQQASADSQTSKNHQQSSQATQTPASDSQTSPDASDSKKKTHQTANQAEEQATKQQDARQNSTLAQTEDDFSRAEGQQMMEQWLRRIPDDPGGLLRRKFLYQYQRRSVQDMGQSQEAW
jgi:Ca-activated chloride channel family protein